MIKKRCMIYDFQIHSFYYKSNSRLNKDCERVITLLIGSIELDFDYLTGILFSMDGFLPLVKAKRVHIDIPTTTKRDFNISTKKIKYIEGIAYDYFSFFPLSWKYLMIDKYNPIIEYDHINKRIYVGQHEKNDSYIQVNDNIICGFDDSENLKSILILLDIVMTAE